MKKNKIKLSLFLLLLFSSPIFAESGTGGEGNLESVLKIMVAVTAFLVAFIMWLVLVYSESKDTEGQKFLAPFKNIIHALTQSTPVSDEKEILLDHDYDGIRELDNRIPPWWNALFYGAIIFAIIYMIDYHVIGDGNVQENEYKEEVRLAAIQKQILSKSGALISEETVTTLADDISIANGKEIYSKDCVACHGKFGEGLVGPNFTDDYWIHGGGIKNIFRTIKYGVPAKGMISWQSKLSPTQMQEVGSYILTLHGTNPPNPKAPQGELWVEPESQQAPDKKES